MTSFYVEVISSKACDLKQFLNGWLESIKSLNFAIISVTQSESLIDTTDFEGDDVARQLNRYVTLTIFWAETTKLKTLV